jgi:manganese/iron transport system substrate-binding protein
MKFRGYLTAVILILTLAAASACSPQAAVQQPAEGRLRVLSTTSLVADVVAQIAGDRVEMTTLIPPGVDEHGFQPSPQDIALASQVDLIFINGAGLEEFIERFLQNADGNAGLISVSDGIELMEGEAHEEEEGEDEDEHEEGDPHVWTDPNNVLVWVNNIENGLTTADPANAAYYTENANQYRQQLRELDDWVAAQVNQIPLERRKLVTDHTVFTYFASRYGFEQVGAVVPSYSTLAQPSAQELAALEDTIRELQVPAIFVGNTVNPSLSERVAQDTGTKLVYILTGSLTEADGAAPTYIEYIQYNVNAIVEALR